MVHIICMNIIMIARNESTAKFSLDFVQKTQKTIVQNVLKHTKYCWVAWSSSQIPGRPKKKLKVNSC